MIWFFYNILFSIGFLLMLPRFYMRMKRRGGYRQDFENRFGNYRPEIEQALKETRRVWVHAVSVGEVSIAFSFMDAWRKEDPDVRFVLSLTTSTAADIARKRLDERDTLIYFPVDWPPIVNKVVTLINPRALFIVETEIWPNLVRRLKKSNIPVGMINGRISDKSYPRYLKVRFFTKRLLPLFDMFCLQSEEDKERIVALGGREETVHVLQSAKYEVATRDATREAEAAATLAQVGFGPEQTILMGASTWPGEEKILCDIFQDLRNDFPQLKLLLVPRHFERAADVLRDLQPSGLKIRQKSKWDSERERRMFSCWIPRANSCITTPWPLWSLSVKVCVTKADKISSSRPA